MTNLRRSERYASLGLVFGKNPAGVPCFWSEIVGACADPPDTVPADCRSPFPSAGISEPFCSLEPVIVAARKISEPSAPSQRASLARSSVGAATIGENFPKAASSCRWMIVNASASFLGSLFMFRRVYALRSDYGGERAISRAAGLSQRGRGSVLLCVVVVASHLGVRHTRFRVRRSTFRSAGSSRRFLRPVFRD